MDYRLIQPRFNSLEDAELAQDFLKKRVKDFINVKVYKMDNDGNLKSHSKYDDQKIADIENEILEQYSDMIFGQDKISAANHVVAENVFSQYIQNAVEYLKILGVDAWILRHSKIPELDYVDIIEDDEKNKRKEKPRFNYKPGIWWARIVNARQDTDEKPDCYCPYINASLCLKNIDNKDFLDYISKRNFKIHLVTIGKDQILEINLLPAVSYNRIISITKAIHKFF